MPGFGGDLPVFVTGISLGGCIAINVILQQVRGFVWVLVTTHGVCLQQRVRQQRQDLAYPITGAIICLHCCAGGAVQGRSAAGAHGVSGKGVARRAQPHPAVSTYAGELLFG